jgi:DNA glycosylase AlkZ-like
LSVISLKWEQVNAWRLSQQGLSHRLKAEDFLQAIRQSMGIHAQVMSAAEMAIAARVDGISPQAVQSALWQERSLIKTWMMRLTLHLVPAADLSTYVAARRITDINWLSFFAPYGIERPVLDAYLAEAPEILGREPLTRQQFTQAVVERLKSPELRNLLVKGSWGVAYKPLALHGELCFGPGEGQNATFVRPSAWIGSWQVLDPEVALRDIVRRYLMVYGPTRPRNFQVWWWMSGNAAKQAFKAIADETEEVELEGWRATAMKSAVQAMQELEPTGEVHLLPAFDVYTVGLARGKELEQLITLDHQKKVYRQQGWVSAVVVVDGFIQGTWDYKALRSSARVKIVLFAPISKMVQEGLAGEVERLGKFLNSPIDFEFSQQ